MKNKLFLSLLLLGSMVMTGCSLPGTAGTPGPQGGQGVPGEVGPQGPQGDKGDKGEQGEPGTPGQNGADGEKGDKGDTGPAGPQGPQGDKGDTGDTGPQGDKGDKGDTGPIGPQGPQGDKGDTGETGPAGPQGDKGEQGEPGKDGDTPYIGANGNWWIGDKDTGIVADPSVSNDPNVSDGFEFTLTTVNHKAGALAIRYDGTDKDVIMPNYIGTVPVIGTVDNLFADITSLKLSNQLISLGTLRTSTLEKIDFNGAKLKEFKAAQFRGCKNLKNIDIPETLTTIGNNAFRESGIKKIDFKNVDTLGEYIFDSGYYDDVNYFYIPKTIKKLNNTFDVDCPLYFEIEQKPEGYVLADSDFSYYGCKISNDYIYSLDKKEAIIHQYVGQNKDLVIPSSIDNYPVTALGNGAFKTDPAISKQWYKNKEYVYDSVIIPNTVKTIGSRAFYKLAVGYIYIPSSVSTILNHKEFSFSNNLHFFGRSKTYYEQTHLNIFDDMRVNCEITLDNISTNDKGEIFILNSSKTAYAFAGFKTKSKINNTISTSHNGKPVTTLASFSLYFPDYLINLYKIIIPNSITKIKTNAIHSMSASVLLPKTIENVEQNGIYALAIYIEMLFMPTYWDAHWNVDTNANVSLAEKFDFSGDFVFRYANDELHLIGYIAERQEVSPEKHGIIKIPRTYNGEYITCIDRYAIKTSYRLDDYDIYIPNTIKTIEEFAIQGYYKGSDSAHIYLERGSIMADATTSYWFYDMNGYSTGTVKKEVTFDY